MVVPQPAQDYWSCSIFTIPPAVHTNIYLEFDKQTALGVKSTFPRQIEYPEFSQHLAKAVCAEVNTQILSNVPQIDDYSCPMCMELKWRPVRLRCQHVFCIRCLIVMQTNKQDRCPLCRQLTVVDANSGTWIAALADFGIECRFADN